MSGEAFTSAQWPPGPPVTAIEDWVRARARAVPLRTPAQLRQLQFHWGNPPPAADPSTRIFTAPLQSRFDFSRAQPACAGRCPVPLALRDVHRDFHAEPEINRLRSFPFHVDAPAVGLLATASVPPHP